MGMTRNHQPCPDVRTLELRDVIAETLLKNLGLTAEVDLSGVANRTETGNIDALRPRQWTTESTCRVTIRRVVDTPAAQHDCATRRTESYFRLRSAELVGLRFGDRVDNHAHDRFQHLFSTTTAMVGME